MASHYFNQALYRHATGDLDLATADMRGILCMTNTTADTERDAAIEFVDDIGTLDECDGANYVRKALASEAVTIDDAEDEVEFDATDVTWTALGVGTRQWAGILWYQHVTNDADSMPVFWQEFASPVTGDGTDFTVQFDAEGLAKLAG